MNAPRPATRRLSGWGRVRPQTCDLYRPESMAELVRVVRVATAPDLVARGLGRAYGDAALNDGRGVICTSRLDRLLAFDPASGLLRCEGGTPLQRILEVLLPQGWFPPVVPGTKHVTVGGALACDVHGKNHHRHGTFSAFVESFELLTGEGEVVTCSRTMNAEAFWATVGGMGLTGVIREVLLQLRPVASAWMRVGRWHTADLDDTLERLESLDSRATYSVAWIDSTARGRSFGRGVVSYGEHARPDELPAALRAAPLAWRPRRALTVPPGCPGWVLNGASLRLFNVLHRSREHATDGMAVSIEEFFFPLDRLEAWPRLYGRRGMAQYQALLPPGDVGHHGLIELFERVAAARRSPFLAVVKRMGAASGGLLSFPAKGTTAALDFACRGPGFEAFLAELDAVVLEHGGRVYLAKDAFLARPTFERMYPQADRFRQARRLLDPRGRFGSSLGRRLGLGDGP